MKENKIIWLEGMFLQPQHFQQTDRYFENLIQAKIEAMNRNIWGFSKIQINTQLLSLGKISIDYAQGIFQDGTIINIPLKDHRPKPFEVPEAMNNTVLYLGLPISLNSAEAGDKTSEELYRYLVKTLEIKDSTAGNLQLIEAQVGSVACRILTEHDDKSDYHCLQFAKIVEGCSKQGICLDPSFLPICLDVYASDTLSHCIKEFQGLLNIRAQMLADRLMDTQQTENAGIVDFMLLQLINRYESIFHYLINKAPLHPEELFLIIIQLISEMSTFTSEKRRPKELPIYKHDQPYTSFFPAIQELRAALSTVFEQHSVSVSLSNKGHGLWVGQLSEKILIDKHDFILAVYANLPAENIRTVLKDQVKIAPLEKIQTLISRQLPGINIQPIVMAPRQIPYRTNYCYFFINSQHEMWKVVEHSGCVALHIGSYLPGLKLELWAIKE